MLRSVMQSINYELAQRISLSSKSINRVVPVMSVICRNNSTFYKPTTSKKKDSTRTPSSPDNPQRTKRRFVKIDSALSKENKYLYTLPKDPYFSASKIKRILELGKAEDALEFIKALPLRLQATATWNEIISHCVNEGRVKFAESCYSQMRKRGFAPNEYTFTHMLKAYVKSTSPNAVEAAEKWFKRMQDFGISPSAIHFTNLMRVYNHNSLPDKTVELLNRMSELNSVAPDTYTYTVALQACSQLTDPIRQREETREIWKQILERAGQPLKSQSTSLLSRKASQVAQEVKYTHLKKLKIDDELVISLIMTAKSVAKNSNDMTLGLEMINTLFSTLPSTAITKSKMVGNLALLRNKQQQGTSMLIHHPFNVKILDAVLRFAKDLEQWEMCKEYFAMAKKLYPNINPDEVIVNMVQTCDKKLSLNGKSSSKRSR
ncbi:hypothetical protein BDF20DRAFT_836090 [Mycotypha africana]|uniref:uncharacterized protein n=1 Tax=Mycotypha africana TaxID=64632 RepID=UPI002301174F|nr:uncharacterized protein BDF20DRAFT_836090 [Mycotypha africana]KAI8977268.1 hypothetical protein BDF20DRAFT_836090 [Mycotypha africana]